MRTVSISKTLAAASANNIAQSQSVAAGASFNLNGSAASGGVATLDTQRRVILVSGGNDSGIKATITGTGGTGTARSETLTMANVGTAVSVLDYLTVTSVKPSGSTASTVTIGTNGTGSTDWIMPNFNLAPFEVGIVTQVSGTVTYNVETTNDDYWTAPNGTGATSPQAKAFAFVNAGSAAVQTAIATSGGASIPVTGYRYTITSGSGTLTAQGTQGGISNY